MKHLVLFAMGLLSFLGLQAANYQSVDVPTFAQLLQDTTVCRLDVRTAAEYAEGHIEGSTCIDVTQPDFMERVLATIPKSTTVALYCRSGRRSKRAAALLADAGYTVVELKTGYLGWLQAQR